MAEYTAEKVTEILAEVGFESLEDYPGDDQAPWLLQCVQCKAPLRTPLSKIRRCSHRGAGLELPWDDIVTAYKDGAPASELAKKYGVKDWVISRRLGVLGVRRRRGDSPRLRAGNAKKAVDELTAAGYEVLPDHPYPGSFHASWTVRCAKCNEIRLVTLGGVRSGLRCAHGTNRDRSVLPVKDMVADFRDNMSMRAIADKYGVDYGRVRNQLVKLGLKLLREGEVNMQLFDDHD